MIRWLVLACLFLFSLYPTITRIKLFQEFPYNKRNFEMEMLKVRRRINEGRFEVRVGPDDERLKRKFDMLRRMSFFDEEMEALRKDRLPHFDVANDPVENNQEQTTLSIYERLKVLSSDEGTRSAELEQELANAVPESVMIYGAQDIEGENIDSDDTERIRQEDDSSLLRGGIPAAYMDHSSFIDKRQPRLLPDTGRQDRTNEERLPESFAEATTGGDDVPTRIPAEMEAILPLEDSDLEPADVDRPLGDLGSEEDYDLETLKGDVPVGDSNSETDASFAEGPIQSKANVASAETSVGLDDRVDEMATKRNVVGVSEDNQTNGEGNEKRIVTQRSEDYLDVEERIESGAQENSYRDHARIIPKPETNAINDGLYEGSSTERAFGDDVPLGMLGDLGVDPSEDGLLGAFEGSIPDESEAIIADGAASERSHLEGSRSFSREDDSRHVDEVDSESESTVSDYHDAPIDGESSTPGEEDKISDTSAESPQLVGSYRLGSETDADLIDFDVLDGIELEFSLSSAASAKTFVASTGPDKNEAGRSKTMLTDDEDEGSAATSAAFLDLDDTATETSGDPSVDVPIPDNEQRPLSEDNSGSAPRKTPKEGSLASFFQKVSEQDAMRRQAERKGATKTENVFSKDKRSHSNVNERAEDSPEASHQNSWGVQRQFEALSSDSLDADSHIATPLLEGEKPNADEIYQASHLATEPEGIVEDTNDKAEVARHKASVNTEFVEGLDDIDKFLEKVEPPDELDVGAAGSSIQEVLMGQSTKIVIKRITRGIRHVRRHVKARVDKFITRHRKPDGKFALVTRDQVETAAIKVRKAWTVVFNEARGLFDELFGLGDDYDDEDDFSLTEMELSLQNIRQRIAQKQTVGAADGGPSEEDVDAFIRRQMTTR